MDVTLNYDDYSSIYEEIFPSLWFKHLQLTIVGAQRIAHAVHVEKTSAVIHCSDGWDRTAQLSSLSQLLLDPYYRTIKGFCSLIEKDWLCFGHMFGHRIGHGSPQFDDGERSPIFLQFLDCVYQIHCRATCDFEFNEHLLTFIMDECYSCRFGNFLYSTLAERRCAHVETQTLSLWAYVINNSDKFTNDVYRASNGPIMISYQFTNRNMKLWPYLYRWNRKLLEAAKVEYATVENLKSQISEFKALHRATEVRVMSVTAERLSLGLGKLKDGGSDEESDDEVLLVRPVDIISAKVTGEVASDDQASPPEEWKSMMSVEKRRHSLRRSFQVDESGIPLSVAPLPPPPISNDSGVRRRNSSQPSRRGSSNPGSIPPPPIPPPPPIS
jgi:hypothetical protein